jgi:hypothetical protein
LFNKFNRRDTSMRVCSGFYIAAALTLFAVAPVARAADPLKQCSLLSPQAAAALFGAPLDPPRDMFIACAFFGPGGDDKKGLSVSLITGASMGGMPMTSMYDSLLDKSPGTVAEPIAGFGEKARLITSEGGKTISIQVLYHNNIFTIAANNSPNPNIKAGLKETAKQILAKF